MSQQLRASRANALQNHINQQTGFPNPVYAMETDLSNIDGGFTESKEKETVEARVEAKSVLVNLPLDATDDDNDELNSTAAMRRARFARSQSTFVSQEVDLLFCGRIFTIKTRSYINFKKSLQMLKPFGVLVVMLLMLIFLFRVDSFASSGSMPNPDENI